MTRLFCHLFCVFSLRHLLRHRVRALAVVIGVALGAMVFSSVRLSINAAVGAFDRSMTLIAGAADVSLSAPGGRVPETLLPALLRDPAVAAASPFSSAYVAPAGADGASFLLIGIDPILDRSFRAWETAADQGVPAALWADLITVPGTLLLAERLGRELGASPGDALALTNTRATATFRVLGRMALRGLALVEGGRVAVTDIATFQEFAGVFGAVDRIDVRLKPGHHRLSLDLPPGVRILPPGQARQSGQAMIRSYRLNLSVLSFVSLFVGMFLVYSLVALNAAARRTELATLRALGAPPRLIFLLFLAEGGLFGVVGWLLAVPAGVLMLKYLLHGIGGTISTLFVRVQVDGAQLAFWELAFSFLMTVAVAVLAAWQPAWDAMRVAPGETLRAGRPRAARRGTAARRLMGVGVGAIALVWPLSQLPGLGGFPLFGYAAIFLLFVGFSLLSPGGLQGLGMLAAPLMRRIGGQPAYLAARYLRDTGTRTAISVGALITAVALFTALVVMVNSFRTTVELWVHQTVSGDLFAAARMAEINDYRDPLPPATASCLETLAVPAERVGFRRVFLEHGAVPYQFEAIDFAPFLANGGFFWLEGDPAQGRRDLLAGRGIVISEVLANRSGTRVGDPFEVRIGATAFTVPVVGVIRDYRTRGGVAFYSRPHFSSRFADHRLSGIRFFLHVSGPEHEAAVQRLQTAILRECGDALDMISGRDLRRAILDIFDETFGVTTLLLLIALVVAALGIATTLTLLVLERSRQLTTLLAIGGSPGQMRAMIFWEAALMVVMGETAGLLCGFYLSYLLVFVINRQSFGWTFFYLVDWRMLALSMPLIFLAALTAALPASRLVLRQSPAALLRES
jgi:putative ABC transport system permease protein